MNQTNAFTAAAIVGLLAATATGFGISAEVKTPGSTPLASTMKAMSPRGSDYALTASCIDQVRARLTSPKSLEVDSTSLDNLPPSPLKIMGLAEKDVWAFETNAKILEDATPEHAKELAKGDPAFAMVRLQLAVLKEAGIKRSNLNLAVPVPPDHPAFRKYRIAQVTVEGSASNGFGVALPLHATCESTVFIDDNFVGLPTVTIN